MHPPLGKLLLAWAGEWASWPSADFAFQQVGSSYDEAPGLPYVALRLLVAGCAALLPPLGYALLRTVDASRAAAWAGALFVLCDNALVTYGRLILLDSFLLLFTLLSVLCVLRARRRDLSWLRRTCWWLVAGLSIGAALSTKLVALSLVRGVYFFHFS